MTVRPPMHYDQPAKKKPASEVATSAAGWVLGLLVFAIIAAGLVWVLAAIVRSI